MKLKTAIIGGLLTGLAITAVLIAVDQLVTPLVERPDTTKDTQPN